MDHGSETLDTKERSTIGRRRLVRGAAWSIPAVAAVGAAPAMAQSASKLVVQEITASRSGANVTFTITLKNNNNTLVTISDIQIGTNWGWTWYSMKSTPDTFAAGAVGSSSFRALDSTAFTTAYESLVFTLIDARAGYNVQVVINAGSTSSPPVTFTQS